MRPIIQETSTAHTPETLVQLLQGTPGIILLRSSLFDSPFARYSFIAADPFLTFRSFGSRCELKGESSHWVQFGNPWHVLEGLMERYELIDDIDMPFPLGGCFGYWGYDLKNFVEPTLPRCAINDLELPDCQTGFYDSLVVFDHRLAKTWIVSTGINIEGSRDPIRAATKVKYWSELLQSPADHNKTSPEPLLQAPSKITSNFSKDSFIAAVSRAQDYIRSGDIYQVNLAQRLCVDCPVDGWNFFLRLENASPAPFSAFFDCETFQLASSSPEQFLKLSGAHVSTRPIKGTRPRSSDPNRDAQLNYELLTSTKELAELVMITDLLRNDLGRFCEYGSVQVPELMRLERYPQVQHLVSTVEGRLRDGVTHFAALASCFPGGSITGAPKIRAMEVIDELEPVTRGPYTGAMGYLGFNRESQLSIIIRTAVSIRNALYFNVGAGIVADSSPEAEYQETLAKAGGFLAALSLQPQSELTITKQ